MHRSFLTLAVCHRHYCSTILSSTCLLLENLHLWGIWSPEAVMLGFHHWQLFLHKLFFTVTRNNPTSSQTPDIVSHLASGKFALTEPTGSIMCLFALFLFLSSSVSLTMVKFLRGLSVFQRLAPHGGWALASSELQWESDWMWLVLWVGIIWNQASDNDGELAVKCLQVVREIVLVCHCAALWPLVLFGGQWVQLVLFRFRLSVTFFTGRRGISNFFFCLFQTHSVKMCSERYRVCPSSRTSYSLTFLFVASWWPSFFYILHLPRRIPCFQSVLLVLPTRIKASTPIQVLAVQSD